MSTLPDVVEHWFGADFSALHPRLQSLHRGGGLLRGPVDISYGSGVARAVGRLLAWRMGIHDAGAGNMLEVIIASDASGLHWSRRFNHGPVFKSVFQPSGGYPNGYWVERSGLITLWLQVTVQEGAWHWQQKRLRLLGMPLPGWLMPRTIAHKEVVDGNYVFSVEIRFPALGKVLAYCGTLDLCAEGR